MGLICSYTKNVGVGRDIRKYPIKFSQLVRTDLGMRPLLIATPPPHAIQQALEGSSVLHRLPTEGGIKGQRAPPGQSGWHAPLRYVQGLWV